VVVLFVGHNLLLKNFSLMRRVFRRLADKHSRLKLVIIGKRRPRSMPPWSLYVGEQADMASWYQAADCVAHPTFYDSCANVVLEGMSSDLPVVASDVCGANELIEDGVSGFVLPVVGSGEEIERRWFTRLEAIGADADLRRRIGTAARSAMLKNDFGDYVTRFEDIMRLVLARKRALTKESQAFRDMEIHE
jgi:glycosyltransferase involved in cell wall biosynthesis